MPFYVYILRTSGNTLYIGQTNNLDRRLTEHLEKNGRGAKYTRSFKSVKLVWQEEHPTRNSAMKREAALKKLTRPQKDTLIKMSHQLQ